MEVSRKTKTTSTSTTLYGERKARKQRKEDMRAIRISLVRAMAFAYKLSQSYLPTLLFCHQSNKQEQFFDLIRDIQLDMKRDLSEPAIFLLLQVLVRLCTYCVEAHEAQMDERYPKYPNPQTHVDLTMQFVWSWYEYQIKDMSTTLRLTYDWEPYKSLFEILSILISDTCKNQFGFKIDVTMDACQFANDPKYAGDPVPKTKQTSKLTHEPSTPNVKKMKKLKGEKGEVRKTKISNGKNNNKMKGKVKN